MRLTDRIRDNDKAAFRIPQADRHSTQFDTLRYSEVNGVTDSPRRFPTE